MGACHAASLGVGRAAQSACRGTLAGVMLALGGAVAWLSLAMVVVGAANAVARYVGRYVGFNLSSNAYLELQWYMFSALFLLGAVSTLTCDAHVRVDVIYGRLSSRARHWIDAVGTAVFLLPFCAFGLWVSWPAVAMMM